MVAIARLVAHAVIGAAGTVAAIEFFLFEEELRGMDESRVHLIIYIRGAEDVVDALPLAFIAVSASHTVGTRGIFCKVMEAVLADLVEKVAVWAIVEVASHQELGFRRDGSDGVDGLAEAVCGGLTERTAITFATEATGQMNDKDVERVASGSLATGIEDITSGTHAFYGGDADGIATDRSKRERGIEQRDIDASDIG